MSNLIPIGAIVVAFAVLAGVLTIALDGNLLSDNNIDSNDFKFDVNGNKIIVTTEDEYGTQTAIYTNNNYEGSGTQSNVNTTNNSEYQCIIGNKYEIVQGEYTISAEMKAKVGTKCEVLATLTRAPGLEAFAIGANATCYLTDVELNNLGPSTNISDLNCSGYLYELAKMQ
jgi:hypothetical protein